MVSDTVLGALIGVSGAVIGSLLTGMFNWLSVHQRIRAENQRYHAEIYAGEKVKALAQLHSQLVECRQIMSKQLGRRADDMTERYLFRDEHDRWFILQPSAKGSEAGFVRWVYLQTDRPKRLVQSALRRRTVIGYDYVRRSAAPDPIKSTVTAMFVTERWPETLYECGSCEALFNTARDHALHCWNAHPWVPNPEQVRRRH